MNIFLWILQVLLAVHTAIGAVWKISNTEQAVPSLSAIPHAVWIGLIGIEILCSIGLVIPAISHKYANFVLISAGVIAAEMLIFSAIHLASGTQNHEPMIYWLVGAAVCGCIIYGRLSLQPL